MDAKLIEELARKLVETLPPGVRTLQADVEKNAKALLESAFARMNLVTREEFEVQRRVLERSREKIAALEAEIRALEERSGAADGR